MVAEQPRRVKHSFSPPTDRQGYWLWGQKGVLIRFHVDHQGYQISAAPRLYMGCVAEALRAGAEERLTYPLPIHMQAQESRPGVSLGTLRGLPPQSRPDLYWRLEIALYRRTLLHMPWQEKLDLGQLLGPDLSCSSQRTTNLSCTHCQPAALTRPAVRDLSHPDRPLTPSQPDSALCAASRRPGIHGEEYWQAL